ncbi:hypothetical protein CEE45_14550 [Candidatus Heimdallarchaeota archaeon B3_Heim]|nr:MAG: hypothetical protein CEE45_14550 [Candidatus Heimdallarchaeota archaeon B3_Heim]
MDKEDQQETRKRLMELLNSVRFPDPKIFKNLLEDSKKLSFEGFKQYDLDNYSSHILDWALPRHNAN